MTYPRLIQSCLTCYQLAHAVHGSAVHIIYIRDSRTSKSILLFNYCLTTFKSELICYLHGYLHVAIAGVSFAIYVYESHITDRDNFVNNNNNNNNFLEHPCIIISQLE